MSTDDDIPRALGSGLIRLQSGTHHSEKINSGWDGGREQKHRQNFKNLADEALLGRRQALNPPHTEVCAAVDSGWEVAWCAARRCSCTLHLLKHALGSKTRLKQRCFRPPWPHHLQRTNHVEWVTRRCEAFPFSRLLQQTHVLRWLGLVAQAVCARRGGTGDVPAFPALKKSLLLWSAFLWKKRKGSKCYSFNYSIWLRFLSSFPFGKMFIENIISWRGDREKSGHRGIIYTSLTSFLIFTNLGLNTVKQKYHSGAGMGKGLQAHILSSKYLTPNTDIHERELPTVHQ